MIATTELLLTGTLPTDLRASVQDYHGRVLETDRDLKTGACCSTDGLPATQRETLAQIYPEVSQKFYGCGSPIPPVLDITGRHIAYHTTQFGYPTPNVELREGFIDDLRSARCGRDRGRIGRRCRVQLRDQSVARPAARVGRDPARAQAGR